MNKWKKKRRIYEKYSWGGGGGCITTPTPNEIANLKKKKEKY